MARRAPPPVPAIWDTSAVVAASAFWDTFGRAHTVGVDPERFIGSYLSVCLQLLPDRDGTLRVSLAP
jgi:hypothetical protein